MEQGGDILLDVKNLQTQFATSGGVVRAVDGVSWDVRAGETVALVGESGCGKSVSALSIMRLVSAPAGRILDGQILFKGRDLLQLSEDEMRQIRGREIGMIFQEPMTSLNPVLTVGRQLTEPPEIHLGMSPAAVAGPRHRAPGHGRHLGPRAAPEAVPAPVQRRHAAADDDRHGHGLQPRPHPGRRAHHRARRDHPGPDPRAHEGPVAQDGRGHGHDHAQSRGRRPLRRSRQRDVRRPHRGARDGPARSTPTRATPTLSGCFDRCRASTSHAAPSSCPSRASRPDLSRLPPGCAFQPRCQYASSAACARRRLSSRSRPATCRHAGSPPSSARRRRRERGGARPRRSGPARSRHGATRSSTVRNLSKHFEVTRRLPRRPARRGEGGGRRVVLHPSRGDAGPRGRVRLRQDDDRPLRAPAREADAAAPFSSRARISPRPRRPPSCGPCAGRCR